MIYISAQEDKLYFIWQLEIQIFNFRRVGIDDGQIHILIAYKERLSEHAKILKVKYPKVGIFFYKGTSPVYVSAIRPKILAMHFERFSWLRSKTIFYHDSDIIFRELPEIKESFDCLGSDTRGYTGPSYVNSKGPDLLYEMCAICCIRPAQVTEENSAGAQYILNGVDHNFWLNVESDAIELYKYMAEHQSGQNPIQKWCADMWAMQYNLLYQGRNFKSHKELSFCWATDSLIQWERNKIYHDAGVTKSGELFFKGAFQHESPIGMKHEVNPAYCSLRYVEEMDRLYNVEG